MPEINKDVFKNLAVITLTSLFLVVMHLSIRNLGGAVVTPVSYLVWMAVSVVIIFALMHTLSGGNGALILPDTGIYILFFAALFILPSLFNPVTDAHAFIFKKAGLIAGIIFFFSLHQFRFSDRHKEKFIYVLIAAGVIEAAIGLIQYFMPEVRIPLIAFSTSGRIFGNFQQQNLFAAFLATSLIASLFAVTGPLFRGAGGMMKAGLLLAVMVISAALFIAGSRAGIVGMLLGSSVLILTRFRLIKSAPVFILVWILAVTAGLGLNIVSEKYIFEQERGVLLSAKKFRVASDSFTDEGRGDPRMLMYRVSLEMIKDKPFLGHGPGGFESSYVHYRKDVVERTDDDTILNTFTYYPHNEALSVLIESGLVGGIGLLVLASAFLIYIFRLGAEKGGLYLALLMPVIFHAMVEFPFQQSAIHWVLFLMLCYLMSSHFVREIHFRPERWMSFLLLAAVGTLFVFTNLFLVRTLSANMGLTEYYRLLTSEGVSRMKLADPALNNLYLGRFSQRMIMDIGLGMALQKNDSGFLEKYVGWAEEVRVAFPHYLIYEGEVRALFALGREDEALKLLDQGSGLYPDNRVLLSARDELVTDSAAGGL